MKKKLLSLFLLLTLLLSLVGCGANPPPAADTALSVTTTTVTTVPTMDPSVLDAAFQLGVGESLPEEVTLTGTVSEMREAYHEGYGNASFELQVQGADGAKTIYCYRVKPAEGTTAEVAVGDIVTLTGTILNYKGTIEFYPATYVNGAGGGTTRPTTTTAPWDGTVTEDGIYTSKEEVALYLHTYGKLPSNFVTKSEFTDLGKPKDKCCGGDRFQNREGLLPNKSGRLYYECDIDTLGKSSRGQKRIVFSNDGLIYYTGDHYASFTLLYGEP